jgi:hypothetical protein
MREAKDVMLYALRFTLHALRFMFLRSKSHFAINIFFVATNSSPPDEFLTCRR